MRLLSPTRLVQPLRASFAELQRLSDEDVVECLKAGNNDALAVLFDRYQRLILSVASRILRDDAEAEDVTQNVFLEIYRAVAQFDPAKGSTKVWMLQYAYHRSINRRQQLIARNHYQQESFVESDESLKTPRTWGNLTNGESQRLVEQALAALSAHQRKVIESACFEGLSMKEIAERTGDTLVAVRHNYYRGLQKLRSMLRATPEPEPTAAPGQEVVDAGA